jgi:hypothetical protein
MNESQILSVSITVLAIFAGALFNNVRISDMSARFGDLSARIGDVNRRIDDVASVIRAEMRLEFERTNAKIDAVLKMAADIDQRVTSLEARKS